VADPRGGAYVCGEFSKAGVLSTPNVACWNDTAWEALCRPAQAFYVYTLAIAPNGDLYVSGIFSAVDGVPAHNLARKKQKALALAEGFLLFASTPFK
jgi:hypothetical protein